MGKINAYIVKKLQEGNKYVPSRNSFPRIRSPSLLENLSHVYDFKEHGEQSDLTKKRPLLASPRGGKQNKFISERAVIFHPCCLKPQR